MPKQREVQISRARWRVARAVLADGATDKVAADRLDLSPATTKQHMKELYAELGVAGRTQLAIQVWSGQLDLLDPRGESMIAALEEYLERLEPAA